MREVMKLESEAGFILDSNLWLEFYEFYLKSEQEKDDYDLGNYKKIKEKQNISDELLDKNFETFELDKGVIHTIIQGNNRLSATQTQGNNDELQNNCEQDELNFGNWDEWDNYFETEPKDHIGLNYFSEKTDYLMKLNSDTKDDPLFENDDFDINKYSSNHNAVGIYMWVIFIMTP